MFPGKTREQHVEFVHELVKLNFFYLWSELRRCPQQDFRQRLRQLHVYRRTTLFKSLGGGFDEPRWQALETAVWRAYQAAAGDFDSTAFEAAALDVFRGELDAQSRVDYDRGPQLEAFQCGSLKFDPPRADQPDTVLFHIANAVAPASIFDDPCYLPRCFLRLLDLAEARHQACCIATSTWLNGHPRWLRLFPAQWLQNLGDAKEVGATMGFWGQFVNARGLLHGQRAALLRQTGLLPFDNRPSWCTIAAMREHLRGMKESA